MAHPVGEQVAAEQAEVVEVPAQAAGVVVEAERPEVVPLAAAHQPEAEVVAVADSHGLFAGCECD
jgi:hypothetical protein